MKRRFKSIGRVLDLQKEIANRDGYIRRTLKLKVIFAYRQLIGGQKKYPFAPPDEARPWVGGVAEPRVG